MNRLGEIGPDALDQIASLCVRALIDAPAHGDLARALFAPSRPAFVYGDPARAVVATVIRADVGAVRLLAVDPAHRGKGLGRRLLQTAEEALAGVGTVQSGADAPDYLWPGIDARETAAICLFESMGYRHEETLHNMEVDLTRIPPEPPGAARAPASEREEVAAWLTTHWPEWLDETMRGFDAGTFAIARGDGGIVGFAAWDVNRKGWFGPTAVRPDLIGKGLGRPLLLHALHAMRDGGLRRAEIAWIGPHKFYARTVGATIDRTFWVMRKAR